MSTQDLLILITGIDLYTKKFEDTDSVQILRDKLHKQLIKTLNN